MSNYPHTLTVTLARIEQAADAQDVAELSAIATEIAHARGEQVMSKRNNTRNYGATEEQMVSNIDSKRAILKVIGNRPMKCNGCAGSHLLVAEGAQLLLLNPCPALSDRDARN